MTDDEIMSELNILIEDTKNKLYDNKLGNSAIILFTTAFNTEEDLEHLKSNYKNNMETLCTLIRNVVLEKAVIEKLGDKIERNWDNRQFATMANSKV